MTCSNTALLIAGGAFLLSRIGTVFAQDVSVPPESGAASTSVQEVVVTGTLIKQSDLKSMVPMSTISPQQLQSTGDIEVVQAFREDPEFGSDTRGSESNLNGAGLQALDLRNLGTQRTLVLVDGRRLAQFSDAIGNGGVDIGMIPQSLISRIDVERDGAGPTYGSDAVSGVVNFILDRSFKGLALDASYGISGHGDGPSWHLSTKAGFSSERGSLVVGADYLGRDVINADSRDWLLDPISSLSGTAVVHGAPVGPGGEIIGADGHTVLACYAPGGGANLAPNCPTYDPNAAGINALTLGDTIRDIGALGHYNITDTLQFTAEAFFTERQTSLPFAAYSLNTTTTFGPLVGGFEVPATSSNNPYGQAVGIRWLTLAAGNVQQITDSTQLWANFGFDGPIGEKWIWEVLQTSTRDTGYQQYTDYPVATNIRNLFIPADCAADPICSSIGPITNLQTFFADGAHLTPAQAGYGWYDEIVNSAYEVEQSTATLSGPVFALPGGDVQVAVGGEYRRTSGEQTPDAITATLNAARTSILPWDAAYSTAEGYGEIQAPLLANAPFAHSLDLDMQARYTSFKAAGTDLTNATTWKVGLSYAPTSDVRIRAAVGTSFRAPTVSELYSGGLLAMSAATDPCNPGGVRTTNPTINANCIAAGAPVGPTPSANTLTTVSAGSPALQPERGKSYTIGAVFTPSFMRGLSATLDYYHIEVTNAIGGTNLTQALQACYADPNFMTRAANPTDPCYGYNQRAPDQTLEPIHSYEINISKLWTDGLDFAGHYQIGGLGPVPGALALDAKLGYLIGFYDSSTVIGQERGTFSEGPITNAAWPIWKGSLTVSYILDRLTVSWMAQYISAMKDQSVLTGAIPASNPLGYSGTPNYVLNDLTIRWQRGDAGPYAMLGVDNVFDKNPPFAAIYAGTHLINTLSGFYDVIGRYFFVDVGYKF